MTVKLTEKQRSTFEEIVAATHDGRDVYHHPIGVYALVQQGLIAATGNSDGAQKGFQATDAGIQYASKLNGKEDHTMSAVQSNQASNSKPKMHFEIEDNVALPEKAKRNGGSGQGRTEMYPFSKLEVGQSFFVPPTDSHPEPAKSMAGTVSQAMRRYAEPIEGQTRKARNGQLVQRERRTRVFRLVQDTKDGVTGARVFRVA